MALVIHHVGVLPNAALKH